MLIMIINYDHHLHRHHHDHDHHGHDKGGRDRLIEGSRGILQGTTAMLISFDASQVSIITISIIITIITQPSSSVLTPSSSAASKSDKITILHNVQLLEWTRIWFEEKTHKVRKLCRDCKKVLDYLAISEVRDSLYKMFLKHSHILLQNSLACSENLTWIQMQHPPRWILIDLHIK